MTPIIDIVFLLIIFFVLVCQFIEAENFPVTVPDKCDFAQDNLDPEKGLTTVTVMKSEKGEVDFAVGSGKISASNKEDIIEKIAHLINGRIKNLPDDRKVVTLRIDREICFADAQYALAAIAASDATNIQLAAFKDERIK